MYEQNCRDVGGGSSLKIALLDFVGGLRSLLLWLLLLLEFSSPPFALIIVIFGHLCGYLTDIYNNQPLRFYDSLEQELYNPQTYFAAADQMVLLSFWFARYYDHNVLSYSDMRWIELNWLVCYITGLRVRRSQKAFSLKNILKLSNKIKIDIWTESNWVCI